jgi:hypothetical protein
MHAVRHYTESFPHHGCQIKHIDFIVNRVACFTAHDQEFTANKDSLPHPRSAEEHLGSIRPRLQDCVINLDRVNAGGWIVSALVSPPDDVEVTTVCCVRSMINCLKHRLEHQPFPIDWIVSCTRV